MDSRLLMEAITTDGTCVLGSVTRTTRVEIANVDASSNGGLVPKAESDVLGRLICGGPALLVGGNDAEVKLTSGVVKAGELIDGDTMLIAVVDFANGVIKLVEGRPSKVDGKLAFVDGGAKAVAGVLATADAWTDGIEVDGTFVEIGGDETPSWLLENCGKLAKMSPDGKDVRMLIYSMKALETVAEGIFVAGRLAFESAIVVLGSMAEETDGVAGETSVADETICDTAVVSEVGTVSGRDVKNDCSEMDVELRLNPLVVGSDWMDDEAMENARTLLLLEMASGEDVDILVADVDGGAGATMGGTCTLAPVATVST